MTTHIFLGWGGWRGGGYSSRSKILDGRRKFIGQQQLQEQQQQQHVAFLAGVDKPFYNLRQYQNYAAILPYHYLTVPLPPSCHITTWQSHCRHLAISPRGSPTAAILPYHHVTVPLPPSCHITTLPKLRRHLAISPRDSPTSAILPYHHVTVPPAPPEWECIVGWRKGENFFYFYSRLCNANNKLWYKIGKNNY